MHHLMRIFIFVIKTFFQEDVIELLVNVEHVEVFRQLAPETPVTLPQDPTVYVNIYNTCMFRDRRH